MVAGADERTDDFVFVCNRPQLRERFGFRFRLRQVQLPIKPDIFRNSSVDQRIKILKTHLAQHCANFLFVRADVATREVRAGQADIDLSLARVHARAYGAQDALQLSSAACAAANRAMGIRNGLQLT